MRMRYKQWAVDFLNEHTEIVINSIDLNDNFYSNNLFIEIGSGKGDFILEMAKKYPHRHFVAIEKVPSVAGILAKKIFDSQICNVKVFPNDVKFLFDQFKANSIDAIYLNFCDPWPKKRHEKRRLTFHENLEQYFHLLKNSSYVYFKTDNDMLYNFTLEELKLTKFNVLVNEYNYTFDIEKDCLTEYESKFRKLGYPIHRIIIRK